MSGGRSEEAAFGRPGTEPRWTRSAKDAVGTARGSSSRVWTRDLCHAALALLASGNLDLPRRALVYLASSQNADGGFYQNFWLNGAPYWTGVQLDEVAFPILLAWYLHEAGGLRDFDSWPTVRAAAGYRVRHGPATPQDRWEEVAGYSPATLASNIAALTCAAAFAREREEADTARYLQEYADFLEGHVEAWTVTSEGELLDDVPRHYIRANPVDLSDPRADEDPNRRTLRIPNLPADRASELPARNVVDPGFLELVRYDVRAPGGTLVEDSLKVVDTPGGPASRRYNHDGYGQGSDGEPFVGTGTGRAWPLLTGERGHHDLAAGRNPDAYVRAMEWFANGAGLLLEQVWDGERDVPEQGLSFGRPTGSAMPLVWAHAEYVSLLRVQADAPFVLRWTRDGWDIRSDDPSRSTGLGVHFVDLEAAPGPRGPIRFTFRWGESGRWEGQDFEVAVDRTPDQGQE